MFHKKNITLKPNNFIFVLAIQLLVKKSNGNKTFLEKGRKTMTTTDFLANAFIFGV